MNHEKVIARMRKMINAYALIANVVDLRQMLYDLVDLVEHLFKLHAPPAVELHPAVNPRNVCCRCGKKADDLGVCDGKVMCYDCWIVSPVGQAALDKKFAIDTK